MNPGPFQRQLIKPPLAQAEERVRGRPLQELPPFLAWRRGEEGIRREAGDARWPKSNWWDEPGGLGGGAQFGGAVKDFKKNVVPSLPRRRN